MKILLAISGGIDSMYMANRAPEFFPGASFAVAHCNFCLRGDESDGDERFVAEWCSANGMPFHSIRFNTVATSSEEGISTEMAARQLRYRWFGELCDSCGYEAVAVAHNANDNAETLILNLLRGTGGKGLRGMSRISALPERRLGEKGITLIRPVLDISRDEIAKWMTEKGFTWREDRTNLENDFRRNRIRNEVFPVFAGINPSFLRTLNRDMSHFCQIDDIAEDYFLDAGLNIGEGVNVKALMSLKHWKYVLYRLLEPYNFSEETFGKLIALLESERTISGKVFESPTHILSIHLKTISVSARR